MTDIKVTLEQQEQVLIENRDFVIKHLDADDVFDELIQERLIGENAAQRIGLTTKGRNDKNRIILDQLSTAGPGALERFCSILKKKKRQAFIAEQLEKCKGKCKTGAMLILLAATIDNILSMLLQVSIPLLLSVLVNWLNQ